MKTLRALVLVLTSFGALAAVAQAAPIPAPALKLLAITGPTHLAPVQSEVQRVTVEAEGGTFKLGHAGVHGEGTPVFVEAELSFTAGSSVATIENIEGDGKVEPGDRVTLPEEYAGNPILSCSTDCKTPGSTLELEEPASSTESGAARQIFTRELSNVTGSFSVGEEISEAALEGFVYEYFLPGTKVTAVEPGRLTLSNPTTYEYASFEGALELTTANEVTEPLAFDAPAQEVQAELEGLTKLGPGSVSVSGGPGGDAGHPYFVTFGGAFADEDVEQLSVDSSELSGEHPFAHVFTTVPGGNGTGDIYLMPANVGGEPTSGTVTAHVGPLPEGIVMSGPAHGTDWNCSGAAGDSEATCTTTEPVRSLHYSPKAMDVPVEVKANAPASAEAPSEISGGGSQPATYPLSIAVSTEPAPFGVAAVWAASFEADGSPSLQAGGHPFSSAAYVMLNTRRIANGDISPSGDSRDVVVDLPPGFTGNPLATKRCPQSIPLKPISGSSELCNEEMSVGNLDPYYAFLEESLPFESRLFNDVPPKGYAAEFTTRLVFPLQSVVAGVNSEEDFGIRLTGPNNPNFGKIFGVFTAFEGVPKFGNGKALLTNPVNCAESREKPPVVHAKADSYQEPGHFSEAISVEQPALTGCENLEFKGEDPQTGEGQVAFSFDPTSNQGSSPVGAVAHLHIDQPGLTDPEGLATPHLKRSVIHLPAGLSLNPSQANGLAACSEAQIGYRGNNFPMPTPIRFNDAQPQCPDASKLGTAEIKTPLLDNPLVGEVFLATQGDNPFGSLLAVYLVVNDPYTGVLIKLPGDIQPDPQTGRLTAVFDNNPQLPFEDLYLHFRGGGPRSEFATSEVCGNYKTEGEWTPWSAPESGPPAQTEASFDITQGCSASAAARPFHPSFEAGTTNTTAGSYSPLVVKINRNDGEQELSRFDFTMPPGFSGKLKGIPYCTEAQIGAAEHNTGKAEQASPSCPAASKLGTIDAGAGVGSEPFHVQGNLYLAGPYKGAPLSAVAITPALAGPYDLGDVVVRTPLYLNPETAQLTGKSDPIPTILKGIPLKVRSVAVSIDRQGFTLNPTSCEAMSVTASLTGSNGATASPSNRFQVGGCDALKFAPKLEAKLKGGTKRGDHPALTATVTYPQTGSYANLRQISVTLPHSEFLENAHIGTVCTRVQFSASACPAASVYGKVTAETPLLDQPLTGNVYLRSSSNKLPDMVLALHGPPSQPIEIDLDGRIDSINGGIRSTFEAVPDAPVSRVVLSMFGGKKGLLVNSRNLCTAGGGRMSVKMTAHNNRRSDISPALKNQCSKAQRKGHKKKASKGSKRAAAPKRPW
jgi:hypothetical protein